MTSNHHSHSNNSSNFWFGLIIGVLGSSAALYMLGTDRGRKALKQLIKYAEEHESGSGDLTKYIQTMFKTLQEETNNKD